MRVANRLKEELFEENREQGIESKKQKAESGERKKRKSYRRNIGKPQSISPCFTSRIGIKRREEK